MKKLLLGWQWQFTLLLIFCHTIALSHTESIQQAVKGLVTAGNISLPGVTVAIKGQEIYAITDANGRFEIPAVPGDILVFSFTGYKTLETSVTGATLDIALEEDVTQLKEVTVNAGYYKVKDRERTGSIARIAAKDIETQPVTNVLATMQGRMAGVSITQYTGMPGGGFDVVVRGQNSLRFDGNSPLYVIDGVPYSSEPVGSLFTSSHMPRRTSPLNSINPADVESIEVLKDADATAIYGSRGANGVVLVTTKRGKAGKTSFTGNVSSGSGHVTRFMDLMDTQQYLAMRAEAFANDGITTYPPDAYDINGAWSQTRNTDWQEELIGGNASFTTAQASVSGGSVQTQFLMGANISHETTVFPGEFAYNKGNVHLSLNHESIDRRFHIGFSASYTAQKNNMITTDLFHVATTLAPNAPPLHNPDGSLNWENGFDNPLRFLEGKFKGRTKDLVANSQLSYKFFKGFELRSSFGYTDTHHNELNTSPSTMYNPAYGVTSASSLAFASDVTRSSWIVEPQAAYSIKVGEGKLEALAGGTFQQQKGNHVAHLGYGFASNSLIENPASAGYFAVLQSEESVYKYQAFFGRLNFDWKGRYLLNLTGRRDGSSRFGPASRYATFGAVGAAWLFTEEAAVKKVSWLSFGKLRASYGTTGNDQIGDYQYLDTYSNSGSIYQGIAGLMPTRLFNPDFGWETNKKLEVALETGFLGDRVFTTAAWYRNRSSGQLVGVPLPGTTGFTSIQANLDAEVENSGLELTLRTVNIRKDNFSWTTSLNFTAPRNKLVSFPGLDASPYKYQFVIGQPLNIAKVYHFTGVDPATGLYQFEDVNGDGVISPADDREFTKDLNPEFYGGLQNTLKLGGLQLDFLFQFVKQQNFNEAFGSMLPGTMSNQPASFAGHWQAPGDTGPYQLYSTGVNPIAQMAHINYTQSDAAISDASYIRLKNVALSFTLPKKWTKSVECRLTAEGQNLLTFTSFRGADPEFKTAGFLPPLRVITTGIQIFF
jgi:TonB-linked SusC/RagA family outer membrane protein